MRIFIIGAGGGGTWLIPAVKKLFPESPLAVVDGDSFEPKNMDRQLFPESMLGMNKAAAMAMLYDVQYKKEYYQLGTVDHISTDLIFGCVDNHRARLAILQSCDMYGCKAIIAGNEKTSASAMYYEPSFLNSWKDPRVRYPEIATDHTGDPLAREMGCVAEIQSGTTQLVSANHLAVSLAMHLAVVWLKERSSMNEDTVNNYFPWEILVSLTNAQVFFGEERKEP